MAKLPWFPFFVQDWLSNTEVRLMGPAGRGAYIDLLATAWLSSDCGLPTDDDDLAELSGLGSDWTDRVGQRVKAKFFENDGRLYNQRLLKIWTEQNGKIEQCRKAGKRSAEKRRAILNGRSATVDAPLQRNTNYSGSESESESDSNTKADKEVRNPSSPAGDGVDVGSTSVSAKQPGWKDKAFERFWSVVWLKVAKKAALRAFKKAATDKETADRIIEAARVQGPRILAGAKKRDGTPVHPTRWLNEGRYDDEPEPAQIDLTDAWGNPING